MNIKVQERTIGTKNELGMAIRNLFTQRPKTAFVLGGGGNLGAIQVGQLRALLERGIRPDVVVGCSVGSLNGAAIAGNPTLQEAERLADLWRSLTREDVFPSSRVGRGPWMFVRNATSAFGDHGLRRVLAHWLRFSRIEDAAVPLWVVATSLRKGTEHWFSSGDVATALLASTALPGLFPPVDVAGELLIDGGVVNNIPISKAIELRARRIFVLDVGNLERERPAPKRPYEALLQAVTIARAHRFRIEREHVPDNVRLIRLPTVDVGRLRYDDFSRSGELIDRTYKASLAFLDHPAKAGPLKGDAAKAV